jgi:hypothetical protein
MSSRQRTGTICSRANGLARRDSFAQITREWSCDPLNMYSLRNLTRVDQVWIVAVERVDPRLLDLLPSCPA